MAHLEKAGTLYPQPGRTMYAPYTEVFDKVCLEDIKREIRLINATAH